MFGGCFKRVSDDYITPIIEMAHEVSPLHGFGGSTSMPGRARRRPFDYQVFGIFSTTTVFPSLHFWLSPLILSASVGFWHIWQKDRKFAETGCSLPTLVLSLQIASELLSPGLGPSVRHLSLSSQSGCLPCVLGALQLQQTSPRHALWVLRLKADCSDYSERDSGDKGGADSGKGKHFMCLTETL